MDSKGHVCSLELAQRLEELGEKQKCLWYWQYNGDQSLLEEYTLELDKKDLGYGASKKDCYAPTVAELGERLPRGYRSGRMILKGKEFYTCYGNVGTQSAGTEANARAKMKIYLLEKKLEVKK